MDTPLWYITRTDCDHDAGGPFLTHTEAAAQMEARWTGINPGDRGHLAITLTYVDEHTAARLLTPTHHTPAPNDEPAVHS